MTIHTCVNAFDIIRVRPRSFAFVRVHSRPISSGAAMNVLETEHLSLRRLSADDAAFILELVNDPDWLQFIGDRGVHTLADARDYILNGPVAMYQRVGFGLFL